MAGSPTGGQPGVYLRGLSDLRRALGKADKSLRAGFANALREIGKRVRGEAVENARRHRDSGALDRSYRYSVTAKGGSVYSGLPYAPVQEFGGTVHPRGKNIVVPRRMNVYGAVKQSRREIDASLENLLDAIAHAWGGGSPLP